MKEFDEIMIPAHVRSLLNSRIAADEHKRAK